MRRRLLAAVVEWRTNTGFADALRDLVLAPLGIEGYLGAEPPRVGDQGLALGPTAKVEGEAAGDHG